MLGTVFVEAMRKESDEWIRVFKDEKESKRRDLEMAMHDCDSPWPLSARFVNRWLDAMESGEEYRSLLDIVYQNEMLPEGMTLYDGYDDEEAEEEESETQAVEEEEVKGKEEGEEVGEEEVERKK